jgi:hypothetical protein
LGYALLALFAASWVNAQEAAMPDLPEVLPGPLPVQEKRVLTVHTYRVGAYGPWTPDERKAQRGAALWKLYMHGVIDFFAMPIAWESLLGEGQPPARWLDRGMRLSTRVRKSEMPAVKLGTGDVIVFGRPLPYPKPVTAQDTLRVFVWLAAKEANGHVGGEVLPSRTPALEIVATNAAGRKVASYDGPIRTRGTFDWHCYYLDVPLTTGSTPESGGDSLTLGTAPVASSAPARLFVRLRNPTSGTVWFSTLGCEVVEDSNTYTPEEKQDPVTGSLAPYAAEDELVVHLMSGRAYAHPWRFLAGPAGGAQRVPNLETAKGIQDYMLAASKTDETGCLGGCVFLGPWLYASREHPELLGLSVEWHETFHETLVDLQDSRTGFWGTPECPTSMAATTAVVEYFWGGPELVRGAYTTPARPWLNYGGRTLPRAKAILETVLEARTRRKAGGVDVGAWGGLAYEWRAEGEMETDICSLAATRNAFVLLRLASAQLSKADRERADRALEAAWHSVFQLCVLDNGLWKLSARDTNVTQPAFLPRILDLAPFLEERTDGSLPLPNVTAAVNDNEAVEFTWSSPAVGTQSVRVFAVPKGTPATDVHMGQLIGIIEQDGSAIWSMDPIHVAGHLQEAALARWGVDIAAQPDVPFLATRVDIYRNLLKRTSGGKPLAVSLVDAPQRSFFVAGVRASGEQSGLVPVEVAGLLPVEEKPDEPGAEQPAEAPAGADPLGVDGGANPAEVPAAPEEGM